VTPRKLDSERTVSTDQIAQAIAGALQTLSDIDQRTKRIEESTSRHVLRVPEICKRYLARSERWAREHPWVLPNFSESEVPGRPRAWSLSTCEEWYSVPLHVHEAEWFRKHHRGRRSA
jgi:hypothetical protein